MGFSSVQKQWTVMTTDENFHRTFRAKVCTGNHGAHSNAEGHEGDFSSYYPWKLVQAITRHWRDQLAPERHVRLLQRREEPMALLEEFPHGDAQPVATTLLEEEPNEAFSDCEDELEVNVSTTMTVEAMAREARAREQFRATTLQTVLLELRSVLQSRAVQHGRWKPDSPSTARLLLGGYSHGAFKGITKATSRFPEVTKYINTYLAHHAPQHQWSSVLVGFNSAAVPHQDHHNLKGSMNLLHGCGDYEGGGLWLEGTPPTPSLPVVRRRLVDGTMASGYVVPTRGHFIYFDPAQKHATQAWQGLRITVGAYTTRSTPLMELSTRRQLENYKFKTTTSGTAKPTTSFWTATATTSGSAKPTTSFWTATATTSGSAKPTTSSWTTATTTSVMDAFPAVEDPGDEGPSQEERDRWQVQIAKFLQGSGPSYEEKSCQDREGCWTP